MPMTAQAVKMMGRRGSWMYCPLLLRAYREKSGILQASVDHEPVTEDMQLSQRYAFVLPETVALSAKICPEPPAL